MNTGPGNDPLRAALLKLGELDEREAAHYKRTDKQIADILVKFAALKVLLREQGEALDALRGLEATVRQLGERLNDRKRCGTEDDEDKYEPSPVVQWWHLLPDALPGEPGGELAARAKEREAALARLRSWVASVYTPLYGKLAEGLGECWEAHPLALVTLDWLSELWSTLYLTAGRDARQVGQQAELGTRILPAAADLLREETQRCQLHPGAPANGYAGAVRR